jgi:hypothetical protein
MWIGKAPATCVQTNNWIKSNRLATGTDTPAARATEDDAYGSSVAAVDIAMRALHASPAVESANGKVVVKFPQHAGYNTKNAPRGGCVIDGDTAMEKGKELLQVCPSLFALFVFWLTKLILCSCGIRRSARIGLKSRTIF